MKIFMYSDLHISRSSSILPNSSDLDRYTYRQKMILDTGKFLTDKIKELNPDIIINLGDTFDQHTLTSYDIDVASKFFKYFEDIDIPHIVLVGNHDMVNYDFNAVEMLKNIDNITVIDNPCTLYENLAFVPYFDYKDILTLPDGVFLFSHLDIQGSSIRKNINLDDGIAPTKLDKYKLVFNGHIHKPSIMNNIVNVGSITTHSFSDDDSSVPQCYLFDTETLNLQTIKSNICPLFRKVEINTIDELNVFLNKLDNSFKYILQINCPFDLKEDVKEIISSETDKVLNSRLNIKVTKQENNNVSNLNVTNLDIKQAFTDFINNCEELKFPKQLYINMLNEIKFKNKGVN